MGGDVSVKPVAVVNARGERTSTGLFGWRSALWAVNGFFLLISLFVGSTGREESFLSPFYLAYESNIATWWSGAQLMLFGLIALSLGLAEMPRDRGGGQALVVLGTLGLGLFADEIGSVHERVDLFLPIEGDLALAPFALAGAAALAFALWVLRARRDRLGNAWLAILGGFAVLGSTYLHEFAEHRLAWPEWARGLRVMAEEGTELVGMFILLNAVVALRNRVSAEGGTARRHEAEGDREGSPKEARRAEERPSQTETNGMTVAEAPDHRPRMVGSDDVGAGHVCAIVRSAVNELVPSGRAVAVVLWAAVMAAVPIAVLRGSLSNDVLDLWRKGDFGNVVPVLVFACGAVLAVRRAGYSSGCGKGLPQEMVREGILARAAEDGFLTVAARKETVAVGHQNYSWRWFVLACVMLFLSVDAECLFHHYVAREEAYRWRGEFGLIWGVPLWWVGAILIPSLNRGHLLIVGLAAAVLVAIGATSDHAVVSRLVGQVVPILMVLPLWRVDGRAGQDIGGDDGLERIGVRA